MDFNQRFIIAFCKRTVYVVLVSNHKHPDSALIDRVGKEIVSRTFGLTPQALWMWRKRGIPVTKRIAFAKVCADHGIATPDDFFAAFELKGAAA